uniref:Uncharacterized protein n=1 Tax=Arundo donax TaxID=35708 RepID=A0A0A8Z4H1_ARUDO
MSDVLFSYGRNTTCFELLFWMHTHLNHNTPHHMLHKHKCVP